MNCPVCGNSLTEKKAGEITVDVCDGGCGGIWFDNYELRKVDEPHESAGEALLDVERRPGITIDPEKRITCPRCGDVTMMRHFFSTKMQIAVDECPECGGIWLDAGELGAIRTQFASEEERNKAAEKYFSELFGVQLARMKEESEEKRDKARRIARLFRFLCPTAYIPGKQQWGAF